VLGLPTVHNRVRKNRSVDSKVEMAYIHTHRDTGWWYHNINIIPFQV